MLLVIDDVNVVDGIEKVIFNFILFEEIGNIFIFFVVLVINVVLKDVVLVIEDWIIKVFYD